MRLLIFRVLFWIFGTPHIRVRVTGHGHHHRVILDEPVLPGVLFEALKGGGKGPVEIETYIKGA